MAPPPSLLCVRCGAPLGDGEAGLPARACTFCGAAQPVTRPSADDLHDAVRHVLTEDRNGNGVPDALERHRPAPAPHPAPVRPTGATPALVVAMVGAMVVFGLMGALVFLGGRGDETRRARATAPAIPASVAPAPVPTPEPPPPPPPASATPSALSPKAPTGPRTNEEWGRTVVASRRARLQGCVEQDLLRFPDAPKGYTVTVYVEEDGAPKNSATTFSPTPSRGFARCAGSVVFYAFTDQTRDGRVKREPYTFTTSFAFPNAKPAAKAETGRGWD